MRLHFLRGSREGDILIDILYFYNGIPTESGALAYGEDSYRYVFVSGCATPAAEDATLTPA